MSERKKDRQCERGKHRASAGGKSIERKKERERASDIKKEERERERERLKGGTKEGKKLETDACHT